MKLEEIGHFLKDTRGSSVIEVAHITHHTSKLMVTKRIYLKKYIERKNDRCLHLYLLIGLDRRQEKCELL